MGGSLLRRKWHHLTFHAELSSRNKSPQKLILDLQKHWTIHSGSNDSKRIRATRWPTKGTFLVIFQTLCLKCCEERLLMALILQEALRETCCRALKMCASPWNAICLLGSQEFGKAKWKFTHFGNTTNFYFLQQHSSFWWKIHMKNTLLFLRPSSRKDQMALEKVKGQRSESPFRDKLISDSSTIPKQR